MIVGLFNDKSLKTPIFDKQQLERLISVDKCDYDPDGVNTPIESSLWLFKYVRSRSSFAR